MTLEAERFDISYLGYGRAIEREKARQRVAAIRDDEQAKITAAAEERRRLIEERKTKREAKKLELLNKLYFNAGRYTAGARDKTAVVSYQILEERGAV